MDGSTQNNPDRSHPPAASASAPATSTWPMTQANSTTTTITTTSSSSSRRRLTKKPPSSHQHQHQHHAHRSSSSVDAAAAAVSVTAGRFDALSIQSKRSSTSLTRAPSAPLARSPTKPTSTTSNNASNNDHYLPTSSSSAAAAQHPQYNHHHHQSQQPRSLNPSPILPGADFAASKRLSFSSRPTSSSANPRSRDQYPVSDPHYNSNNTDNNNLNYGTTPTATPTHRRLNSQASEDFIGAPFDGSAILNRIEATKSPAASPQRPSVSRAAFTSPDPRSAGLLGLSPSVSAAADNTMAASEKSQGSKPGDNSKRFSDESKEPKMASVLRKKSGFSGFMTSLVGSPKKPTISAPENPVHVTHVGYDSSTGQFTVSRAHSAIDHFSDPPLLFTLNPLLSPRTVTSLAKSAPC